MTKLAKAVLSWEIVRLLAFVVAPVWGAGVYVAESTTSTLEAQLELAADREHQYLAMIKGLMGLAAEELPTDEYDPNPDEGPD